MSTKDDGVKFIWGSRLLRFLSDGDHGLLAGEMRSTLACDISQPLEPADWLTFSEQWLRTITAAAVFHDELGLE